MRLSVLFVSFSFIIHALLDTRPGGFIIMFSKCVRYSYFYKGLTTSFLSSFFKNILTISDVEILLMINPIIDTIIVLNNLFIQITFAVGFILQSHPQKKTTCYH